MGHTYIFVDQMGLDKMGINNLHYNLTHMKASAFAEIFCRHCWLHKRRDTWRHSYSLHMVKSDYYRAHVYVRSTDVLIDIGIKKILRLQAAGQGSLRLAPVMF